MAAMEPMRGLSDEGIERVNLEKGSSEYWGLTVLPIIALLTLIGAGFFWKYHVAIKK